MDHESNPINGDEKRRRRVPLAIERGVGRTVDGFEERVLWPAGDAAKALAEVVRRCFEWVAWVIRRGLVWPLQDRYATLGAPARVLSALAVALVVGVGVAAVASSGGDSAGTAAPERVAAAPAPESKPAPVPAPKQETSAAPTLEGPAPVFKATESEAKADKEKQAEPVEPSAAAAEPSTAPSPTSSDPAIATIGSGPAAGASAAPKTPNSGQSAAGIDGAPAGEEAIAVARDFAGAFVLYETGGEESKVRTAFGRTATAELSKSLLQRPPRLPSDVKVPKAKVVNVVAGPSQGGVYTISVSLLRVGLTSELRLDMEKLKGKGWRVTNVLG
jgi:hypothetical protein